MAGRFLTNISSQCEQVNLTEELPWLVEAVGVEPATSTSQKTLCSPTAELRPHDTFLLYKNNARQEFRSYVM